ncbi:molybdenum cofactor guanylyltransferase [Propionibacteriaceae bacterium Y1685]|uniref:molybdenum cofactor guanylyltransferase n=1 Tax=Microlunatus sp. Y1700 TaxID=3418487 RepID=UPI003B7E5E95
MITSAALVLTGGRSSRFGDHKPAAMLSGRTLVDHVLQATAGRPVIVVGSPVGVPPGLTVVTETPAGGGPVAAIAEGVRHLPPTDVVLLLAADLPMINSRHLDQLTDAAGPGLACFVDPDGRPQWLCSAWPSALLNSRLAAIGDPVGQSLRHLATDVPRTELPDPTGATAADVDTLQDLASLQNRRTEGVSDVWR